MRMAHGPFEVQLYLLPRKWRKEGRGREAEEEPLNVSWKRCVWKLMAGHDRANAVSYKRYFR
jgi:hypothetical protein